MLVDGHLRLWSVCRAVGGAESVSVRCRVSSGPGGGWCSGGGGSAPAGWYGTGADSARLGPGAAAAPPPPVLPPPAPLPRRRRPTQLHPRPHSARPNISTVLNDQLVNLESTYWALQDPG